MQGLFFFIYKIVRRVYRFILLKIQYYYTIILFYLNNIKFKKVISNGIPFIWIDRGASCTIGKNFKVNNGLNNNAIGCNQKCTIRVSKNASLKIGDNVGISQSAIICHYKVIIKNHVKIGGGCCIYDTDFHSLNPIDRMNPVDDIKNRKNAKVEINDNVFIGAHSVILKGVTIGENSIIAAGSIVSKSIPSNEIWGGNPAKFIRKI